MDNAIVNLQSTTFSGRRFTRKQIAQIQDTVKNLQNLSRREIAHTICEHFQWFTPSGTDRVHACLNTLEEMEKLNIFCLPAKKKVKSKYTQKEIARTNRADEQETIDCTLDQLAPITLQTVTDKEDVKLWNEFIDRYHYLGYKRPIGPHLRYYIIDKHGRKLGCLLFSFATKSLSCRDQWIEWEDKARQKRLDLIINNNRFLIFPWIDVKCLASKALSMATSQVAQDWEERYDYQPVLLETFVDSTKYKGTCYQAANWKYIGKTKGRKSTQQVEGTSKKEVYVYPLSKSFRSILNEGAKKSTNKKKTTKPSSLNLNDPFLQIWQKILFVMERVAREFGSAMANEKANN